MHKVFAVAVHDNEEFITEKLKEYTKNNNITDYTIHKEFFFGKLIGLCIRWEDNENSI